MHKHSECFQPDHDNSGGERYSETCFTLSDDKFKNDPWAKQGDAHCPELSVYALGYSISNGFLSLSVKMRNSSEHQCMCQLMSKLQQVSKWIMVIDIHGCLNAVWICSRLIILKLFHFFATMWHFIEWIPFPTQPLDVMSLLAYAIHVPPNSQNENCSHAKPVISWIYDVLWLHCILIPAINYQHLTNESHWLCWH